MNKLDQMFEKSTTPADYAKDYNQYLVKILSAIESDAFNEYIQLLLDVAASGKTIYIIGNGGSAATASHYANDISFGVKSITCGLKAISLTDNNAVLTALGNDYGYEYIFSKQLEKIMVKDDILIAISASGNSENIIDSGIQDKIDAGGYVVSNVKTIIEKVNRISDSLISIHTHEKTINEQSVKPRVLSGSMLTISKNAQSTVNLQVTSESGICIIGQNSDCLVSESTRKPGQIFEVVQIDGLNFNVRYSGPDVRLEKFSILPESSDEFLPDTNWNVEVIKDNEVSRMYYKVTYKTLQ